jgi:aspartyl-tRNA(Asn)/glutamyl-tRNA(Gln) amidotransferase subunit A
MSEIETAVQIADAVKSGAASAREIAERTLARIQAKNPELNAFLTVSGDEMLAAARAVDEARARGEAMGPLAGVPVALKDALCTQGIRTTCASRMLEGYVPPYDATVVAKLLRAGAVIPGKTNMDEFAMGSSNETSAFGPARNPRDTTRTPGGSSGGSAVAVAAGLSPVALGSDTGGSIRQPASLTGTVGVKPTYGRVSRFGLVAFASSLDQIGPFASDVRSAARVLGVIAGHDGRDATSAAAAVPDFEAACGRSVRGLRLGVPDEYFAAGLDPAVEGAIRDAVARLERDGAVVRRISLPHTRHAVATYYVLATAEASSNLSRFDGVRYGLRVDGLSQGDRPKAQAGALRAMYGATRDAGFGAEVKRRILLGTFVLSAGYYDAYYQKAQRVRTLLRRDFEAAFADVDAIVCPTAPTTAFRLGEKTADPLAMYLSDVYTLPASLAGLPAASVPVDAVDAPGAAAPLPVGLQIVAPAFREDTVIALAAAAEAGRARS